jgi:hypothetical protein
LRNPEILEVVTAADEGSLPMQDAQFGDATRSSSWAIVSRIP